MNSTEANEEGSLNPTGNSSIQVSAPSTPPNPISNFIFNYRIVCYSLVAFCGLVGSIANGLVLAALKKQQSKTVNNLIVNQIGLDLFASISLAISYSAYLNGYFYVYPNDAWGNFLCRILANGLLPWAAVTSSIIGLVILTLERYFKIVYPFGYKRHYSIWMTRTGIGIACLSGLLLEIVGTWTSQVKDGKCYKFAIWSSPTESMAFSIVSIVIQYFFPLVVFFFGYGSILMVIKRRPGDLQSHGQGGSDVKNEDVMNQRIQMNIIKMLITVTVAFVICCSPNQIYYMMILFKLGGVQGTDPFYYVTVVLIFSNVLVNPFIYALKHDDVRKQLSVWFRCSKGKLEGKLTGKLTMVTTDK